MLLLPLARYNRRDEVVGDIFRPEQCHPKVMARDFCQKSIIVVKLRLMEQVIDNQFSPRIHKEAFTAKIADLFV